jgi:hypothetical protein
MALDFGTQELDRYIPSLARKFKEYENNPFNVLDHCKKIDLAKNFFSVELTKESIERFVRLTDEYMDRQANKF